MNVTTSVQIGRVCLTQERDAVSARVDPDERLNRYRKSISSMDRKRRNQSQQPLPDCVVLWLFPPEDHAAWIAAGLGEIPYEEYSARVQAAIDEARSLGHRVELLHATVSEVIDCMKRHNLQNDPPGRATAYSLLFAEQMAK